MSLQLAAQHLAAKGRGKDSRLVHMTPGELKGLQALAKAKGGSLTINPETGLPEAGFLDDILPIAATAATMAFFPAAAPALGGMFGATGALATGLGAGLMAGGYNLLGQAISGQPLNLGKAAISGGLTGLTAGALQGAGMYTPTSDVMTKTAATSTTPLTAAQAIDATPAFAYTPSGEMVSSAYPASVTGAFNTAGVVPPPPAGVGAAASSGLTGNQKLALGLGGAGALSLLGSMNQPKLQAQQQSPSYIRPYTYSSTQTPATGIYPAPYARAEYDEAGNPIMDTRERDYFDQSYTALEPYQAASGGLMNVGPVERMSRMDQERGMYPQGMMDKIYYSSPTQRPASMEVIKTNFDSPVSPMVGLPPVRMADGGYTYDQATQTYSQGSAPAVDPANIPSGFDPEIIKAYQAQNPNLFNYDPVKQRYSAGLPNQDQYNAFVAEMERKKAQEAGLLGGGMMGFFTRAAGLDGFSGYAAGGQAGGEYNLGSYSDGGRLLKGPGDGMSDNIPATIGKKQPARLADGEFVVPADVVSHLGNGSTDAGAKRLYAMMDKVRKARTGTKKQGKEIKAEKYIPA